MASAKNSSEFVKWLSNLYAEDAIAVEETYPGIFSSYEGDSEGEIDLLFTEGGVPEELRAYEIKESSSLNQETLITQALEAKKQCGNIEQYFNSMGYNTSAEYVIKPEYHLKTVYEIFTRLEGAEGFAIEDAKSVVSEPGQIPHVEDQVLEKREDGLYEIEEQLLAVLNSDIIQP